MSDNSADTLRPGAVRAVLDAFVPRAIAAADYFGDAIPDYYDVASAKWHVDGFWTEGFWPGLLWWLYAHSGEPRLRAHAARTGRLVARRKAGMDDHDLGFLFHPSCVLEYEMTGSEEMLPAAIAAAQRLARRFSPTGRFISAHGPLDGPRAGFAIIDTVMNLRLLLWAAQRTGDTTLADVARETAATIARAHVRPDGSSCQVLWFDPVNGRVLRREAVMAVSEDSCWARGQAWGVHGFARVGAMTRDPFFQDVARRMAAYFVSRVPPDGVVFHDLDDPAAPAVPKDTSAQAIATGGLLTLAEVSAGQERARWLAAAGRLLAPLLARHLVPADPRTIPPRGFLSHGCKSLRKNQGLVSELVFGDYYFVAALIRWRRMVV
jgi:unsaturated chondroitin disaccharide hydrolase